MVWLPILRVAIEKLAVPAASVAEPIGDPLSLKFTVPVGVPAKAVTFAVKVTDWPRLLGFCDEVSAVWVVVTAAKVKRSAADVADVPTAVVTVISTVPVPAGEVAVIWVLELTVKPVAGVAPNVTAVAAVKPVPVMMTVVPPLVGPAVGEIDVTVGADAT